MIAVKTALFCDGCGAGVPGLEGYEYVAPVLRSQLEEVRDDARDKGWRHYRAKNNDSMGDYCPKCQAAHEAARQAKATAKRRR